LKEISIENLNDPNKELINILKNLTNLVFDHFFGKEFYSNLGEVSFEIFFNSTKQNFNLTIFSIICIHINNKNLNLKNIFNYCDNLNLN